MLRSAGVLAFRRRSPVEVLIGHMGGPFWARKQEGAWSIPKGLLEPDEDALAAARREFEEETGLPLPAGRLVSLGAVRTSGGKAIVVWALEADLDVASFSPGTVTIEWPPRAGRMIEVPEIDQVRWVPLDEARRLLTSSQRPFLDRLQELVGTA